MAKGVDKRLESLERFYGEAETTVEDRELMSSFDRVMLEYVEQLGGIRAPGFRRAKKIEDRVLPPEAESLWGPDQSQWHVDELAAQRAVEKERERGTSEDILEVVEGALELWRERAAQGSNPRSV